MVAINRAIKIAPCAAPRMVRRDPTKHPRVVGNADFLGVNSRTN
jgi:hypothetical protein